MDNPTGRVFTLFWGRRGWRSFKEIDGYLDRLIPVATINPSYAAWEQDLDQCINELGMKAVKVLPLYHGILLKIGN